MQTKVELEGVNGERFVLAGDGAGDKGVWLATGVTGLYDPPVKTVYEEPGNYPGARYLTHRIMRRDIVFKVMILNDEGDGNRWMSRDAAWKKAWAFDRDCRLIVTTDSGVRYLKLRLGEAMDISLDVDPETKTLHEAGVIAVAQDPFWYEDDVVFSAVTQTDTRFNPNNLPWPWPQPELPTEDLVISIDATDGGVNPTDQTIWPVWTVPGSTEKPAEPYIPGIPWLGAPKSKATIWTLPDYSFTDPEYADRRVRLPALIGGLRQRGVRKVYIDGRPTAGTFTLSYGSETTAGVPFDASTAQVKSALEALAGIAYDDVSVDRAPRTNEVQTVKLVGGATGGSFTLNVDGHVTPGILWNASAYELAERLAQLPNVDYRDVSVRATSTNEVQEVQVTGEPTGGTFTLTFDGQTTQPIPARASAVQVYTALIGLSNIDILDVAVTKDIFSPWSPYMVRFGGKFAGVNLQPITGDASQLTGGVGCAVEVKSETEGGRLYEVTFQGKLAGINMPMMQPNSHLTGGNEPGVVVATVTEGSRPYIVTFKGNLEGQQLADLTIDTSGLSGGTPSGRVVETTESKTYPAENAIVDTDPRVEQVVSESESQLWARMNGVRFRHPIPPYTEAKDFHITVSGAAPGQMVTLRLPRPWSRPWGLE